MVACRAGLRRKLVRPNKGLASYVGITRDVQRHALYRVLVAVYIYSITKSGIIWK